MAWTRRVTDWFTYLTPGGRLAVADRAASLCEDRAWDLVERRIMRLAPHELRGYVRARTRGLSDTVIRELPDSFARWRWDASFRAAITDCLVHRLCCRAAMAQMQRDYRHAA